MSKKKRKAKVDDRRLFTDFTAKGHNSIEVSAHEQKLINMSLEEMRRRADMTQERV